MITGVGLIKNIKSENFIGDGNIYLIKNMTEERENEQISLTSKAFALSFDSKINNIINAYNEDSKDKTLAVRNDEIKEFFEDRKGQILDIIFFADTGLRGLDKVVLAENSILYFEITANIKFGFFINKTMAEIIFEGVQSVDKD